MPKIDIEATFTVRFRKTLTKAQFAKLERGHISLDDVIDESEPYRLASTSGDLDMEWDYPTVVRKKGARAR